MKQSLLCFFYLIFIPSTHSQTYDLCGIWLGENYPCYTIPQNGQTHNYIKTEVIDIQQNGTSVTATKITGDDCVTAGNITWFGNYTSSAFTASFVAGSPLYPNSALSHNQTIFVIDSNRLESTPGMTYLRASCFQIDSMFLEDKYLDKECLDCDFTPDVEMPNVFTPNGDGVNDHFVPLKFIGIKNSTLTIYNRWGNQVFQTQKPFKGWDGTYYGEACMAGTYYWVVNCTDRNKKTAYFKGFVTLIK